MPHKRLLIVMSIFAVDIFAAFVWLFYTESPYYVLKQAQNHAAVATSVAATITITANGKEQQFHTMDFLKSESPSSSLLETSLNARVIALLDLHALGSLNSEMQIAAQVKQENLAPLSLSLAFLSSGDERFVRFGADPESNVLQSVAVGKWVSVPAQYLPYPFLGLDISVPVSADREQKLRDLFRATKFFSLNKELPEAADAGQKMFHYSLNFRPDAVRGFQILATSLREQRSLSDQELVEMTKQLEKYAMTNADVWIGKKDFAVHRLLLRGNYIKTSDASDTPFAVDVHVDSWNAPVSIDVPSAALPLNALFVSLNSGSLESAENVASGTLRLPGNLQQIGLETSQTTFTIQTSEDTDNDGLSNTLEAFYRTDPLNPDTDGDGYTDGFEVNNGFNPTGPGTLFGFGK